MHICNYCGRVLKHDYEKCPGCGSSSFKNKAYLGETIIKNPPKDGYKVNTSNYEKFLRNYKQSYRHRKKLHHSLRLIFKIRLCHSMLTLPIKIPTFIPFYTT